VPCAVEARAQSNHSDLRQSGTTSGFLADPEHKVVDAYGSLGHFGPMTIANRNTFLIDPTGKIAKVWTKVDPSVHSGQVLTTINAMQLSVKPPNVN
jgi:peroxiredoxin Q/BCP